MRKAQMCCASTHTHYTSNKLKYSQLVKH